MCTHSSVQLTTDLCRCSGLPSGIWSHLAELFSSEPCSSSLDVTLRQACWHQLYGCKDHHLWELWTIPAFCTASASFIHFFHSFFWSLSLIFRGTTFSLCLCWSLSCLALLRAVDRSQDILLAPFGLSHLDVLLCFIMLIDDRWRKEQFLFWAISVSTSPNVFSPV